MGYPDNIKALLEKYWEAETTLEEEKELREYFTKHGNSNPGIYFSFLAEEAMITMPKPQTQSTGKVIAAQRRFTASTVLKYAAVIAAFVAAGYLLFSSVYEHQGLQNVNIAYQDSYDNPEAAYEEAREALLMVAQKINNTQNQAAKNVSLVEPYTEIVKPISSH